MTIEGIHKYTKKNSASSGIKGWWYVDLASDSLHHCYHQHFHYHYQHPHPNTGMKFSRYCQNLHQRNIDNSGVDTKPTWPVF